MIGTLFFIRYFYTTKVYMIINRLLILFVCFTLFDADLKASIAAPSGSRFSRAECREQINRLTHELNVMNLGKKARRWRKQRITRLTKNMSSRPHPEIGHLAVPAVEPSPSIYSLTRIMPLR
jgi:hypothetical protein